MNRVQGEKGATARPVRGKADKVNITAEKGGRL